MIENNRIKAGEWFEKAKHDLATVELIIRESGYADTAAVLLQQSAEKYLKGFLINEGQKLIKTHVSKVLVSLEEVKVDYETVKELVKIIGEEFTPLETTNNNVSYSKQKDDILQKGSLTGQTG